MQKEEQERENSELKKKSIEEKTEPISVNDG